MSVDRLSTRWALTLLLALTLAGTVFGAAVENPVVQNVCGAYDGALASTCNFSTGNAGNVGRPVSARTDFIEDWDTLGYDGLTLATHELFHAIGFTVNYANFAGKLIATPGAGAGGIPAGSRSYSNNGAAAGILMALTPSNQGTHADPNATGAAPWPATGYNQAADIMQPTLGVGIVRTLSATDFSVLNDAFGWGATGINIVIVNLGLTHDDTDMAILNNAVAAINAQWPVQAGAAPSPVFTWTVAEVNPEPATWSFLVGGVLVFAAAARRRRVGR